MAKNHYSDYNPSDATLIMVYNLMFNPKAVVEYSEVCTVDENGKIHGGFTVESNRNQEIEFLQKEAYEQLTSEAKEILSLIFSAPKEVMESLVTPKYGLLTKRSLKKYLMKKGWREKKIETVFSELKTYVMNIY